MAEETKQPEVLKEKYSGVFNGKEIRFNRNWSNYRFSDEECEELLAGNEIHIRPVSKKTGKPYDCYGKLEAQSFTNSEGKEIVFYGFKPDFETKRIPESFQGHQFTDEEIEELQKGETIYVIDLLSNKTGNNYSAYLRYNKKDGLQMAFGKPDED